MGVLRIEFGVRAATAALVFLLAACGGGAENAPAANPAPNQSPIALAGPDRTVAAGSAVQLDGSQSNDPNGAIAVSDNPDGGGPFPHEQDGHKHEGKCLSCK